MSSVLVAFLFAAGVTAWVYAKIDRKDGGNMQSSVVVAAVVFVIAFVVGWSVMDLLFG